MVNEIPDVDFKTIEKVIKAHWKFESDNHGRYCAICTKELTQEERGKLTPHDFLYTCNKHKEYSTYFQIERVRRELGIKIDNTEYFQ
jgi:hypothetical protein